MLIYDSSVDKSVNTQMVRQVNEKVILDLMRKHGELSIPEIQSLTSLTYPTVAKAVDVLKEKDYLEDSGEGASRGGRRPRLVKFRYNAGVLVGVEIDSSYVKLAAYSMDYQTLANIVLPLSDTDPARVIDKIVDGVQKIQASLNSSQVLHAVGIGCPGMINPSNGTITNRSSLKWLSPVDLRNPLIQRLGVPVIIENDINVAALGEMNRVDIALESWAYISVSTGVGSGLIYDHHIMRGHTGTAGELGHVSIDANGILCECGNRGCLEKYIASPAISKRLDLSKKERVHAYHVLSERVSQSDPDALIVYGDVVKYLSVAILGLLNLLNPSVIILGGTILELGDSFLQDLCQAIALGSRNARFGNTKILYSELGLDAVVNGGAHLADQHIFGNSQIAL